MARGRSLPTIKEQTPTFHYCKDYPSTNPRPHKGATLCNVAMLQPPEDTCSLFGPGSTHQFKNAVFISHPPVHSSPEHVA